MIGTDNDASTSLNPGVGGDTMNETGVTTSSGTFVKSPRVVPMGDDGQIYGHYDGGGINPMPTADQQQRRSAEFQVLYSAARLDAQLTLRHRERVRWGERLDIIDSRGPGGR